MLQVMQSSTPQITVKIDTAGFTNDPVANSKLAYVQSLVSGIAVTIDSDGFLQVYDQTADLPAATFLGFLMLDAAGEDYGNRPAMASSSYSAAVLVRGGAHIINDQIGVASIDEGQPLYINAVGKITNVRATTEAAIGVALSTATTAAPNLEMLLF